MTMRLRLAALVAVLVLVPVLQVALSLWMLDRYIPVQVWYQAQVLKLEPLYVVHQNRVLGPLLLEGVKAVTGLSGENSFRVVIALALVAFYAGLIATQRGNLSRAALLTVVAAQLLLVMVRGWWLLSWDLVDLLVFSGVVYGVARERSPRFFAGLLLVEMFNREVAIILGAWLALRYLLRRDWQSSAAFAVLTGTAGSVVLYLRSLAHGEVYQVHGWPAIPGFPWFSLPANAAKLWELVTWWDVMVPLLVLNLLLLVVWGLGSGRRAVRELSWLYGALWLATTVMGAVDEPRLWLAFVPFVLLWVDGLRMAQDVATGEEVAG